MLDTNAVAAFLARDTSIHQLTRGLELLIPAISLGELYYGAFKSSQTEANIARLNQFLADKVILHCDAVSAYNYGEIKQRLCAKGRPIPENDIWIAAIAKQHQLVLITRDDHFSEVDGLQIEKW